MGTLHRRSDLLGEGHTDETVRGAIRAGQLTRVRPGAYVEPDDRGRPDADARHRTLVEATHPLLARDAVLSHASAVVVHALPSWGIGLRRVHATRDLPSGGRTSRHVTVHAAPLSEGDVVGVDALRVTSIARTVVDVARSCSFEASVAVADAALFSGRMTVVEFDGAVEAAAGRRGIARARAVLAFADGRAGGPGESRSRVRMGRLGVPAPTLQHVVRDVRGRHVGQVDFWWKEAGVVGEFDGMEKYGRSLRPDEKPGDAVEREKRREDALRAQPSVRHVVRWTWHDLDDFDAVATRLHHLLATARPHS
ncbi:hypothetical protein WIS52_29935 [Pseudonocardia nematodicida]|uniref:Transcriptional regulator, AbiEi antitoxin, Type IV TA system n=1 Tax=Pseudonocardia nematodicida TaxID=1206997 RepID=A0ABV1KKI1_9PSEU